MNDLERLEGLEQALQHLREVSEGAVVLVEGRRDLRALERLGVGGMHMTSQRGKSMAQLVEDVVFAARPVVLLMDWDRTGGRNERRLAELLHARVLVDVEARRRLAACCQCRSLEEVPAELEWLRRSAKPKG